MKILILGGTVFLGRHLAAAALQKGYTLTLFNRGQSNPGLFPEARHLTGDRDGDLEALVRGRWDAVIDTCGYVPRIVAQSAALLASRVQHYTFISSISVYEDFNQPGLNETSPVGRLEDESQEEVTAESYGPMKALCEAAVEAALPGQTLSVRPGLIVGPYDPSDRFAYWVQRMARGGEVLAPGDPEAPVQIIDGRDLAQWILEMIEAGQVGVYNATGPAEPLTMGGMLATAGTISGGRTELTWVDEAFIQGQALEGWTQLPLWLPPGQGDGWALTDISRAQEQGLTFRPLVETMADTLAWTETRAEDYPWQAGLKPEREAELLGIWHQSGSSGAAS